MAERQVELYVYDLSQGLARQMSMGLLGIQIDAVYHTSIVVGGREWYYGHGIQSCIPGQTHHGSPMEIIALGTTRVPDEVVLEYLGSMRAKYAPESYDLFLHNCNNFTAELAMFLCGVGIPEAIKNLPQDVLNTPFGQMLRPALERQLRPITTAHPAPRPSAAAAAKVRAVASVQQLQDLIKRSPYTVVFFTSATCPPCQMVYPHFEQLAAADARGAFVKVDVGVQRDIGARYQISATPTFATWSRGEKLDQWSGASRDGLEQKVDLLVRVTFPAHPHTNVNMDLTLNHAPTSPVVFARVPPLDKVAAKLGSHADDPTVKSLMQFLRDSRAAAGAANNAPIPDEPKLASLLQTGFSTLPADTLFPLVDLFRAALADPRVSGWFTRETDHATIKTMLTHVTAREDVPYNVRLVSAQAVCNLWTSPLFAELLVSPPLAPLATALITGFLLDREHKSLRAAASSVAFLVATHVQSERSTNRREVLSDETLIELAASFVEAIERETESADVVKTLARSLALIFYCIPETSDLYHVLQALDTNRVLKKKAVGAMPVVDGALCMEVAALMK